MADISQVLAAIQRGGFRIAVRGDALLVSPFDRLDEKQRQFLRDHKQVLVELLRTDRDQDELKKVVLNAIRYDGGATWQELITGLWATPAELCGALATLEVEGLILVRGNSDLFLPVSGGEL